MACPPARELPWLPPNLLLILFGADGGTRNPRKGAGLLLKVLPILRTRVAGTPLRSLRKNRLSSSVLPFTALSAR